MDWPWSAKGRRYPEWRFTFLQATCPYTSMHASYYEKEETFVRVVLHSWKSSRSVSVFAQLHHPHQKCSDLSLQGNIRSDLTICWKWIAHGKKDHFISHTCDHGILAHSLVSFMDYWQHPMHDGIERDMCLGLRVHDLLDSCSVMMNPRFFHAICPNSVVDWHFCMCSIGFTLHTYQWYSVCFLYLHCLVHRSSADNSRWLLKGTKEILHKPPNFYVGMYLFLRFNTLITMLFGRKHTILNHILFPTY